MVAHVIPLVLSGFFAALLAFVIGLVFTRWLDRRYRA